MKNIRTVALIQARMGSTRLPGKVLMKLIGQSVLVHVVERVRRAHLDAIVVVTSENSGDDVIEQECLRWGYSFFRGNEEDVLDRYFAAAREYYADIIVRITADSPLVSPTIIDQAVALFKQKELDYVSNTLPPRTYPRGLDVEVFSHAALEKAWREDRRLEWREHVTPYIYKNLQQFRTEVFSLEKDYSHLRWTLDTADDFLLIKRIYEHFGTNFFSWLDCLELIRQRPELTLINQHVRQKEIG